MLEILLAVIALAANPSSETATAQTGTDLTMGTQEGSNSVIIGDNVNIGGGVVIGGNQAAAPYDPALGPQIDPSVIPAGLVAEVQTPSGKFMTATEIKPIMSATKNNWIAVREYDGKDLLYVTHLWSWRCGLAAIAFSINDGPMQNAPLPACHEKYATPSAILEEDGLPYFSYALGEVQVVTVQIVYDDLTTDIVRVERGQVLIP